MGYTPSAQTSTCGPFESLLLLYHYIAPSIATIFNSRLLTCIRSRSPAIVSRSSILCLPLLRSGPSRCSDLPLAPLSQHHFSCAPLVSFMLPPRHLFALRRFCPCVLTICCLLACVRATSSNLQSADRPGSCSTLLACSVVRL